MKTIKQLKRQEPVYLHAFGTKLEVIANFEDVYITQKEYESKESPYANGSMWAEKKREIDEHMEAHKNENILFASYECEAYEGSAYVLYEENGKLFEVHGSHCSCMGLEGQWEPEETTLDSLKHRLQKGTLGFDGYSGNEFGEELKEFLGVK
jgi:hypothetical protein